jgi:two-component system NtrC family sensor kinase
MRIATRLWLTLLFVVTLVLGVGVSVRVNEEQAQLLEVTLRDRRFFAHALQAAITRDHGAVDPLAEARAMLDREEVARSHIVARLVSPDGRGGLPRPHLPSRTLHSHGPNDVIVVVVGEEILTYVPLDAGGERVAIELSEPQAMNSLLAAIGFRSLIMQTVALAALAALVTFALVGWLVGRPLTRLASLARRIGSGDLDARVDWDGGGDEVATLAREMNDMADRLLATRRALEESETERAAALEQLRHADRLRTVGQLSSTLAHELGTPLNVVSGHARSIEQEPTNLDDVRASSRVILEQAQRMTRILRNLLDFSRRKGNRPSPHSLATLAERSVETLAPLARRHRAIVRVVSDKERALVRVDAQQMLQMLANLLTNAMQAMPDGGEVDIVVDELDTSPPVGVHGRAGRYARIRVVDQGTGIDPDDVSRLFEPFFTRKPEGEGTGLGLAVVEGIVRGHGGFIEVASELGRGTTISVYLPLQRPGSIPPDSLPDVGG